jgi:hypothetical protein
MATVHSTQERKTVTVVFQRHPGDPGGVMFKVTPEAAEVIDIMEGASETERKDMLKVICAAQRGRFPYTPAQFGAWTPEQRQAVLDSLPA